MQKPAATNVADFIADRLATIGLTQRDVAQSCGFETPNIITMIKQGRTKVPLDRVGALAVALEVDPAHLLRLVMQEYMPGTWANIEGILHGTILTANELELIRAYRRATLDSDAKAALVERDAVVAVIVP